jgi:hypothetical protein
MPNRFGLTGPVVLVGLLLFAAAWSGVARGSTTTVRATNRSMAAVVLAHVDTARTPGLIGPLQGSGNGFANAEVRYGVSAESPNPGRTVDTLVAVYRHRPAYVNRGWCRSQEGRTEDGCRTRTLPRGSTLIMFWQRYEPEEDPGSVGFIRIDGDHAAAAVFFSGPTITGDPERRGLRNRVVTFRELRALARDPRLSWRTTKHMVAVGAEVPNWGKDLRP